MTLAQSCLWLLSVCRAGGVREPDLPLPDLGINHSQAAEAAGRHEEGWRNPGPSACRWLKNQQNTDGGAMARKEQRGLLEEQCAPSGHEACIAAGLMALEKGGFMQPKALSLTWMG